MEEITTQKDIPHTESDAQREKVRIVPTTCIDDFPGHPFRVKDDECTFVNDVRPKNRGIK